MWHSVIGGCFTKHYDLISELQGVHDNFQAAQWPKPLAKLAEKFALVYPLKLKQALK
jgi:hypothetical protein